MTAMARYAVAMADRLARTLRRADAKLHLFKADQPGMSVLLPGVFGKARPHLVDAVGQHDEDDVFGFLQQPGRRDHAVLFQLAHIGRVIGEAVLLVRLFGAVPGFGSLDDCKKSFLHKGGLSLG